MAPVENTSLLLTCPTCGSAIIIPGAGPEVSRSRPGILLGLPRGASQQVLIELPQRLRYRKLVHRFHEHGHLCGIHVDALRW